MLSFFSKIWSVIQYASAYLEIGAVDTINLVFRGVGTYVVYLFGLLPDMPSLASWTDGGATWITWLNWGLPIGSMIAIWGLIVTLWLAVLPIRAVLRWFRLL